MALLHDSNIENPPCQCNVAIRVIYRGSQDRWLLTQVNVSFDVLTTRYTGKNRLCAQSAR